ncbi:dihydrofolate reductase family protein [Furfurilactobacillus entadae]|uniref:dihydrofolate reductase family protein n=1 Tax=Furfurilactobacillus entadae TaxID=2922307 RepID=UPI0038B40144
MMRKVILYIATSLDGRLADAAGEIEWLEQTPVSGDTGYSTLLDRIDMLIMGRTTYDYVVTHTDVYPYADKESIVLTHQKMAPQANVTFLSEDVVKLVRERREQSGKAIWIVGGAEMVQALLQASLIDEIQLFIAPHLLGAGVSLWATSAVQAQYRLVGVKQHDQLAELDYERLN